MASALRAVTSADKAAVNASVPISDVFRMNGELTDERIAMEVTERLHACYFDSFVDRSKIWLRNLMFVYGEQWIRWNEFTRQWLRKGAGNRERRFTTNLLYSRVAHVAARLTASRPGFTAVPLNPDLENRRGAKMAERLLVSDWRELDLDQIRSEVVWDVLLFGFGIIEAYFNPRGGKLLVEYEPVRDAVGNPMSDQMGLRLVERDADDVPKVVSSSYEGRIEARAVSPFSFYWPPGTEGSRLQTLKYIIRTVWMGEQEIRDWFDLDDDFELGPPGPSGEITEPLTSYVQRFGSTQGFRPYNHEGQYLVACYYEQASDCPGFEFGKVFYVVNNKLVHKDRSQFEDGRYPFFYFGWMPRRGQFAPQAWVTDQIEPQVRLNQTISHILTHLSLFSNPNILVPKGSGIPQQIAFNFRRYDYNPTSGKPDFWVPPAPSGAIFQMAEKAVTDLDRVGGQFGFSRGEPGQAPSALYVQYMQDADNTELGPISRQHAEAWERLGEALVDLHRTYDSPDRMLNIIGRGLRPEMVAFRSQDLPSKLKFVVSETSMLSVYPAARVAQMKELAQSGFFGQAPYPPQMARKLLEMVRMPDLLDIETGDSVRERWIDQSLTRLIEEGMDLQVPEWLEDQPDSVMVLKTALYERLQREDVWDWDAPTHERVLAYLESLKALEQKIQEAQQAQQDQMAEKALELQAKGETIKSKLRTQERVTQTVAKTGSELIADIAREGGGKSSEGQKPNVNSDNGPDKSNSK